MQTYYCPFCGHPVIKVTYFADGVEIKCVEGHAAFIKTEETIVKIDETWRDRPSLL